MTELPVDHVSSFKISSRPSIERFEFRVLTIHLGKLIVAKRTATSRLQAQPDAIYWPSTHKVI